MTNKGFFQSSWLYTSAMTRYFTHDYTTHGRGYLMGIHKLSHTQEKIAKRVSVTKRCVRWCNLQECTYPYFIIIERSDLGVELRTID